MVLPASGGPHLLSASRGRLRSVHTAGVAFSHGCFSVWQRGEGVTGGCLHSGMIHGDNFPLSDLS